MKIFFAGATGVIGKELLPLLVESGHEVTAATRKREEIPSIEDHGAEAVVCDALDTESMLSVVAEVRAECVLHELTNLPDAFDPERLDEQLAANNRVRTEGTRNLAKAAEAAGAKKIVAQSLAFGYAPEGSWVKAEEAPLFTDATEPWGASVRAVEALEQAVLEAEVPERVVLRYGHLYGPGTMYAPDGQMGQGVSAGAVPLIGDGDGTFSFIHLSDLASATVAAIEGWTSGLYNVCDDDPALTPGVAPTLRRSSRRREAANSDGRRCSRSRRVAHGPSR